MRGLGIFVCLFLVRTLIPNPSVEWGVSRILVQSAAETIPVAHFANGQGSQSLTLRAYVPFPHAKTHSNAAIPKSQLWGYTPNSYNLESGYFRGCLVLGLSK